MATAPTIAEDDANFERCEIGFRSAILGKCSKRRKANAQKTETVWRFYEVRYRTKYLGNYCKKSYKIQAQRWYTRSIFFNAFFRFRVRTKSGFSGAGSEGHH